MANTQSTTALERIITQLTQDHDQVNQLFREYKRLMDTEAPDAQREATAAHICNALTVHAAIEEEIFYPAARAVLPEDKEELMDHAEVEHGSLKQLIAAIEGGSAEDAHFDARVHVLAEYVTHHVKEEEDEMFSELRQAVEGHDFSATLAQMNTRRTELESQLGHSDPTKKPAQKATSMVKPAAPSKRPRVAQATARKQITSSGSAKKKGQQK